MASQNGWVGFVNIDLTAADKKAVKEKMLTAELWHDWCETQALAGYKISQSYDRERECFVVTMTCGNPDLPNYGYSMSQRHRYYGVAIAALVFVHDEKTAQDDWGAEKQKQLAFDW